MKKIRKILKWIKNLDPGPMLYGLLSAIGLLLVSLMISNLISLVIDFGTLRNWAFLVILLIFSIIFYFPIRKSHEFEIGYIMGFILDLILTIFLYLIPQKI